LVNDKVIKSNYKVRGLDNIRVVMSEPPRDTEVYPENIPLNVCYEDSDILIINKEAGMVVHPGCNNYSGTLVNALVYHFGNLPQQNENHRPGLVHRIDKDTTGLLVVGKNEFALSFLGKQFFDHSIDRKYYALVWGEPKEEKGTIRGYLNRDPADRRKSKHYTDPEMGKEAITHYKSLKNFIF
jgi:23S rRNA pseudouridine1911/1915/1917 synthase